MIPSEEFERYWIYSINESYKFKKSKTERRSGKWLIFRYDKGDRPHLATHR